MRMPLTMQILCEGCQAKKNDTNHWYTLTIRQQIAEVAPLTLKPDGRPYAERDGLQQYYCGRYCLLEAMTKWMDALTTQPSGIQPSSDPVLQLKNEQKTENKQQTEPAKSIPPRLFVLKRSAEPLTDSDLPT
jgi:hypothetical protein